jgi:hypothetical protein
MQNLYRLSGSAPCSPCNGEQTWVCSCVRMRYTCQWLWECSACCAAQEHAAIVREAADVSSKLLFCCTV